MAAFTEEQVKDFSIKNWYDLSGQVAVVTGGATGLGLAITRCLVSAGAKVEELREWYDGYRFGSTEIYNPWSVANYFYNNCQAKPYWTNTSDNEIIREIMISLTPDIAENLFALLQGQTVQASLNMDVIYPRITDGTDTIFSFLLLAGYLKPVSDAVETEFGTFMELALPNKEIRRAHRMRFSWHSVRLS